MPDIDLKGVEHGTDGVVDLSFKSGVLKFVVCMDR